MSRTDGNKDDVKEIFPAYGWAIPAIVGLGLLVMLAGGGEWAAKNWNSLEVVFARAMVAMGVSQVANTVNQLVEVVHRVVAK